MLRVHQAIQASRARRWQRKKSRCQNTRAKDRTTVRARAVARIGAKTTAKAKEAAQPTEASRINSRNQTLAAHNGGRPGRIRGGGTAPVLSPEIFVGPPPATIIRTARGRTPPA